MFMAENFLFKDVIYTLKNIIKKNSTLISLLVKSNNKKSLSFQKNKSLPIMDSVTKTIL